MPIGFRRDRHGLRLMPLAEHAVIADDGSPAQQRRLDAALADAALERLERRRAWERAAAVFGRGLDQMDEGVVVEPQRKIADAIGLCSLQFGKHRRDQLGIAVGQIPAWSCSGSGSVSSSSSMGLRDGFIASCSQDVRERPKDSRPEKYFFGRILRRVRARLAGRSAAQRGLQATRRTTHAGTPTIATGQELGARPSPRWPPS